MEKRARGSRSAWDLLTLKWFSPATVSDINAVRAGESRAMTCHLRSEIAQLPRKFTIGKLYVTKDELVWKRDYRRRDFRKLPTLNRVLEVRTVSHLSEWNIKRGLFKIIAAAGPDGLVELAVPNGDVYFLRSWIEGRQAQRESD